VAELRLRHVVLTSVDRDDLPDGGASWFVRAIEEIRTVSPEVTIEVLTPDFKGSEAAIERVIEGRPHVYNHNLETVVRLYRRVRPGARYERSLGLLATVKRRRPEIVTKSGLMLGLGETRDEVREALVDLRAAGVDALTLGQYLRPTLRHLEVTRYLDPLEFEELAEEARGLGFSEVASGPLVRSSFHAESAWHRLQGEA
jgi:lipoic acid synthetase